MKLRQTRLVTQDVAALAEFYETLTGAKRSVSGHAYVEMGQPCEGLAIVGVDVDRVYGRDVVAPATNRTAILDFEVESVDLEFERLKDIVKDWVFGPKDQPWGNRSMLFRDPDGNLVNVFMAATAERTLPAKSA